MSDATQYRKRSIERMESIRCEADYVLFSLEHLQQTQRQNPGLTRERFKERDRRAARDNREGTYLIRVFAEFETGLRSHWSATRQTDPPSRTRDLLDGTATKRAVPSDLLESAHAVREYRNALVHEREEEAEPIPLIDAVRDRCRFFAYLPPKW